MLITDPFITEPFVTDHVDNGPLLNVYCSVDAKSPNHFAPHSLPRPRYEQSVMNVVCYERVCYEHGLL